MKSPMGRMVALVGDAELDEGNIYEALQEGWKNDLRNTWWVIDYNRQSLDGIVREGLFERVEKIFDAFGWDVVRVKYGALQRAAFAEPGGARQAARTPQTPRCPARGFEFCFWYSYPTSEYAARHKVVVSLTAGLGSGKPMMKHPQL